MASATSADAPTPTEWTRFLNARNGDAAAAKEMWDAHVAWRKANLPLPEKAPTMGRELPQLAVFLKGRCSSGNRCLLVLGAQYDNTVYGATEYALAVASHFWDHLSRDSDEKVTVLIDARGGDGWYNPRPWSILPWVRALVSVLTSNFPERLGRLVVFPVPWVATAAWSAASQLLDERTSAKCQMISGAAGRAEPVPEGISEFCSPELLKEMQAMRDACLGDLATQPQRLAKLLGEAAAPQPSPPPQSSSTAAAASAAVDDLAKSAAALEVS